MCKLHLRAFCRAVHEMEVVAVAEYLERPGKEGEGEMAWKKVDEADMKIHYA